MASVALGGVSKRFGDTVAVERVDLEVADGEFLVLLGPSGCGKTTLLRMIAGLEVASDGAIQIGDRDVTRVHPADRDVAMVFQSYALYPHMTVHKNLAYGLKRRGMPKWEIEERVAETARLLELEPLLARLPAQLSGGQRQRVALGRAIVRHPAVFLLDEPLSNLDAKLRVQTRNELIRLRRRLAVTMIYVTHDQVEAMTMGDRVAVMRKGELQQVATPQELYDEPVNLFVGGFIGSPAMNLLEGTLQRSNGGMAVAIGSQKVQLGDGALSQRPALKDYDGKTVVVGIRPEHLEDASLATDIPEGRRLKGEVALTEALGAELIVYLNTDAKAARTDEVKELARDAGAIEPAAGLSGGDGATLVGRFGARSKARPGEPAEVAVDTDGLHFFDPENGLGIYDKTTEEGT
jgi:multiple sugar transport system ATP-binding protein